MSEQAQGTIETCFVTSKLPTWSGVRQNVQGSDISGLPVQPSNASVFQHQTAGIAAAFKEPLLTASQAAEAWISPVRALPSGALPMNSVLSNSAIDDVMDKLVTLESKLGELEEKLQDIIVLLNN